jgi:hypothetical protein
MFGVVLLPLVTLNWWEAFMSRPPQWSRRNLSIGIPPPIALVRCSAK